MYDENKAKRAVTFINALKHTKGKWRGVPFELLPWQDKIINDVFGTVKENRYRQYNTAYVEIPKKMGKSELAAGVALYLTCGDGEWGAEVYGCASDRQQASIVFDVAVDMVDQCPALKKRIKPIMSVKRLVYKPTNSYYQVLSSEAFTYLSSISVPIKRRLFFNDASPVVATPINGSKTISLGFDAIKSKCSISARGFWVGCFGEVSFSGGRQDGHS